MAVGIVDTQMPWKGGIRGPLCWCLSTFLHDASLWLQTIRKSDTFIH